MTRGIEGKGKQIKHQRSGIVQIGPTLRLRPGTVFTILFPSPLMNGRNKLKCYSTQG
jgi:hypothetical protein